MAGSGKLRGMVLKTIPLLILGHSTPRVSSVPKLPFPAAF